MADQEGGNTALHNLSLCGATEFILACILAPLAQSDLGVSPSPLFLLADASEACRDMIFCNTSERRTRELYRHIEGKEW